MLGELADHRDVLVPPEGDQMIIDPVYSGDDGDGNEEEGLIIKFSRILVTMMTLLTIMMRREREER